MRKIVLAMCVCSGLAGVGWAEEQRVITVTGEGSVAAEPDMATLSLGVTQQGKTAAEALTATSDLVAQVITQLTDAGIAPRDMQTSGVSLQPVWSNQYGQSEAPPEITGYEARNGVSVRVRDLDALGGLMDRVVQDGANTFDGLRFGLQEPEPVEAMARKLAVKDAMARAADLAEAAGVTLGPVQSISEFRQGGGPMMMEMSAAPREAKDVPIAAGELSVAGSVTVVFGIAD